MTFNDRGEDTLTITPPMYFQRVNAIIKFIILLKALRADVLSSCLLQKNIKSVTLMSCLTLNTISSDIHVDILAKYKTKKCH